MASDGRLAGIIARRHYISAAEAQAKDSHEAAAWLAQTIAAIKSAPALCEGIRENKIEAVFWVAVFGEILTQPPDICSGLLSEIAELSAKLLVENYTNLNPRDGNPTKEWLIA